MTDEWISFCPARRERWKSHPSKKAVRAAIRFGRDLQVFSRGVHGDGTVFFLEVPPADWDRVFGEGR